jgi:hypothetical protein
MTRFLKGLRDTLGFTLGSVIFAVYLVPFFISMKAGIILFSIHSIIFGDEVPATSIAKASKALAVIGANVIGAIAFIGWTVVLIRLL